MVFTLTPLLTRKFTVYEFHDYKIRYCHHHNVGFLSYEVELYLSSLIFPILPLCFLIILNSITLYKMRLNAQLNFQMTNRKSSRTKNKLISNSDSRSTITLLTVTFSFVVLSAPYVSNTLIRLYSQYDFHVARSAVSSGTGPLLNLEQYFFTFVLSVSNAINLFLYLLSSQAWRKKIFSRIVSLVVNIKKKEQLVDL